MSTAAAVVLAALLAGVVGFAAHRIRSKRTPGSKTSSHVDGAYRVPTRVTRGDFAGPVKPWLVVVFSSDSCSGCTDTLAAARQLESSAVAVDEIETVRDRDLHSRYGIDAVPTTLVCDDEGAVRRWFLGPVSTADLWGAVAEVRDEAGGDD